AFVFVFAPPPVGVELVRGRPPRAGGAVGGGAPRGAPGAAPRALAAGGDDYLIAPFSPTELAARIQVVLRRQQATPAPDPFPAAQYVRGELTIDPARRQVFLAGQPLRLTGIEYRLLSHLAAHAGHLVTHDQLLWHVWGLPAAGGSGRLRTALKTLRRKLGDDASNPTYIFNEPRFGYRMAGSETQEPPVPEADLTSGS
ncbi:MAG: response regulator transcription factor, partial [Caldilineaceae bacterium SB0662_bin_9]|nr:response regulator transcription factor [Caldilineaceae bacterium SB0662_bin_9]